MHDVLRGILAGRSRSGTSRLFDPGFFQLVDVAGGNTTAFLDDHLAFVVLDIEEQRSHRAGAEASAPGSGLRPSMWNTLVV